jgi:microsomal dipeptidase-like Zn-dependent dipeptidase
VNPNADAYSRMRVSNEIQRLYDLGLRYMFTVHLADNKFGGTPVNVLPVDVASKFLNRNGERSGIVTEPADPVDMIHFWGDNTDLTAGVTTLDWAAIDSAVGGAIFLAPYLGPGPLFTALPELYQSYLAGLLVPAGIATGGADALLTAISVGVLVTQLGDPDLLLTTVLLAFGLSPSDINSVVGAQIMPLGNTYPHYFEPPWKDPNAAPNGVRNQATLTPLGAFAVKEMMKRGMMLDVDHMSQHTLDAVVSIATNVPGGYPLNSGHNSFRELSYAANENHRSTNQLETIRQLGGLMGVGWENGADGSYTKDFADVVRDPQFTISSIRNDCAGTSKTWGQLYLYALEKLHGQNVAFGTDADGLIQFPGPRFGPQSAYGLYQDDDTTKGAYQVDQRDQRGAQIESQLYGVVYANPALLTTAAFRGRAVNDARDLSKGYYYSWDQADFYAAINIFYAKQNDVMNGESEDALNSDLDNIQQALSDVYLANSFGPVSGCVVTDTDDSRRRIKEYAFGLLKGIKGWSPGNDICVGDVGTRQQLGISVYRGEVLGQKPLNEVLDDSDKTARLKTLLPVWGDYQASFGHNQPLYHCQTDGKQWDLNFEGVAHYGLIPDFLQDLHNVGLTKQDMSVLFRSGEGVARMWTRCLDASYAFTPHFTEMVPAGEGNILIQYATGDQQVVLEQNSNLGNPSGWVPASMLASQTIGFLTAVTVAADQPRMYFRLRWF